MIDRYIPLISQIEIMAHIEDTQDYKKISQELEEAMKKVSSGQGRFVRIEDRRDTCASDINKGYAKGKP